MYALTRRAKSVYAAFLFLAVSILNGKWRKNMIKNLSILIFFAFFGVCFSQESVSTKEAGAYQKKSVAFTNFAVGKDQTIPGEWESEFVSVLQNSVKFNRFYYNNISEDIASRFHALPSSYSIEERMNRAVVPAVLAAVDAQKEIRAIELLSQQQKNSFIADRAKESGITEDDINAVMNAVYIFAPVYSGYSDTSYTETYTETYYYKDDSGNLVTASRQATRRVYKLTLEGGAYWWKIDNAGEKPAVKIIARIERTASGISYPDSTYAAGYKRAALRKALQSIADDVSGATMDIADFHYSGQILHKNPRNVVISLGVREETAVDDKFYIYESRENAKGNVTEKKRGWVMVKKVGEKAVGLDNTQSRAQIISGMPYVGAVVREIPHLPFDVFAGFSKTPLGIDDKKQKERQKLFDKAYDELVKYYEIIGKNITKRDKDELKDRYLYDIQGLKFSEMYGPELRFRHNISRFMRNESGSQWWFNLCAKLLIGETGGILRYHPQMEEDYWGYSPQKIEYEIDGALGFEGDLSFAKKIFIRRLAFAPELGFGLKGASLLLRELNEYGKIETSPEYDVRVSQFSFGFLGNIGVEIALTPFFNLGGSVAYHLFTRGGDKWSSSWRVHKELDSSGYGESTEEENNNDNDKYKEGPYVYSGDRLKTNGTTWSAYVSFTIPHNSRKNRNRDFANE